VYTVKSRHEGTVFFFFLLVKPISKAPCSRHFPSKQLVQDCKASKSSVYLFRFQKSEFRNSRVEHSCKIRYSPLLILVVMKCPKTGHQGKAELVREILFRKKKTLTLTHTHTHTSLRPLTLEHTHTNVSHATHTRAHTHTTSLRPLTLEHTHTHSSTHTHTRAHTRASLRPLTQAYTHTSLIPTLEHTHTHTNTHTNTRLSHTTHSHSLPLSPPLGHCSLQNHIDESSTALFTREISTNLALSSQLSFFLASAEKNRSRSENSRRE